MDHHKYSSNLHGVTYNRQPFGMYNPIDGLEPVNDEMRKRPFTVPVVRVEIATEDNRFENGTNKTKQSQVAYMD